MFVLLLFGVLFGFILSRVGATDFDAIAQMFLFEDLHLAGVIGLAIAVAGPLLLIMHRRRIAGPVACAITIKPKPRKSGNLVGGLLFGAGWALTGTCPGTALAQLGEGKLMALFTIAGILAGTALHRKIGKRLEDRLGAWSPKARAAAPPGGPAKTGQSVPSAL